MKPVRVLFVAVTLLASLASCATGGSKRAALGPCCQSAMELVEQAPECCRSGMSVAGHLTGCCAKGLLDSTPDAERPDCCAQTKKLVDRFKPCCREALMTGKPDACCSEMPAALLAQKPG